MRHISAKRISFVVVVLSLIASSVTAFAATPSVPSCPAFKARVPVEKVEVSKDVKLIRFGDDVEVEQLSGQAALAHLRNALSKRPEAFEKARQNLAARGFKPTEHVYVERTLRNIRSKSNGRSPYFLTQTSSEHNTDGEILFWSWDDGNNGTWEGTIQVTIYSNQASTTWDGQIDDSTDSHPWVWYEKTWEGRDRGPYEVSSPPMPARYRNDILLAKSTPQAINPDYFLTGSFYNWAVCWRSAVVGGCTTAAVACRLSGPAWPGCFGAWCVGAEVGGAVGCYFAN
jgi:hypothetical protein